MNFENPQEKKSSEYWLSRAKQKCDEFISEIDPDFLVTIETRDVFPDRGHSYTAPVLLFKHKTRPEIRWSMGMEEMTSEEGEDYIEHRLEEIVRNSYTKKALGTS